MNEQQIYRLFRIGVILKGLHAISECAGGLLLAFVSTVSIVSLVNRITRDELVEDKHDFIATHLLHLAEGLSLSSKNFYALYLLSHGIVKVGLVVGLLRDKLWAYPLSLVVLGLFVLYQTYRFAYTQAFGLIALTVFDVVIMGLIWHEYGIMRGHRAERSGPRTG